MLPIRRLIPVVAIVVAASTPLTACSDDDTDAAKTDTTAVDTTAVATLTETEFVEQGNALCVEQAQAVGEVMGPLFSAGPPSPEDEQAALDQVVTLSRGLAGDLDALNEPSALADDVEALISELEAGTDAAAAQTGAEFFASEDDPWADAGAMAQDLGLDACAEEG